MSTKFLFTILLMAIPSVAFSDDRIDRMATFGEEMSNLMYQAMIGQLADEGVDVSTLKTMIPDTSWDAEMYAAAECILDKYDEQIGTAGVEKMLDDMEAALPELREGGMEAMETMGDMQPEGISEEESIAISRSCGMMQLMQKNMMAGDFVSEVMKLSRGAE
jgi:hypothetical protein